MSHGTPKPNNQVAFDFLTNNNNPTFDFLSNSNNANGFGFGFGNNTPAPLNFDLNSLFTGFDVNSIGNNNMFNPMQSYQQNQATVGDIMGALSPAVNNISAGTEATPVPPPAPSTALWGDLEASDLLGAAVGGLSAYLNWDLQDERNDINRGKLNLSRDQFAEQLKYRNDIQASNAAANA